MASLFNDNGVVINSDSLHISCFVIDLYSCHLKFCACDSYLELSAHYTNFLVTTQCYVPNWHVLFKYLLISYIQLVRNNLNGFRIIDFKRKTNKNDKYRTGCICNLRHGLMTSEEIWTWNQLNNHGGYLLSLKFCVDWDLPWGTQNTLLQR